MIKEAIEYIAENSRGAEQWEINGEQFFELPDGIKLERIKRSDQHRPTALHFSTLQAMVDYLTHCSHIPDEEGLFLRVESPQTVELLGKLQADNQNNRWTYAVSQTTFKPYETGVWYDLESFVIRLMSMFEKTEEREQLINWLGALANENIIENKDDGFSQSIQIRSGISNRSEVKIQNPISLVPFRTFPEVAQPYALCIFRLEKAADELRCALYDADGGAWKLRAVENIKQWLMDKVDIPVLA